MPTSAICPKNPSDVRADVGIRAPILPLSQQPLASGFYVAADPMVKVSSIASLRRLHLCNRTADPKSWQRKQARSDPQRPPQLSAGSTYPCSTGLKESGFLDAGGLRERCCVTNPLMV